MDIQPISIGQQRRANTIKAAGTGAALLGGLAAVAETSRQNDLINNAQAHIVKLEANKTFAEFLLEDKPDLLKEQKARCDELIKQIKDFAARGKLDKKEILKCIAKMGIMGAVAFGGIYYIGKTLMEVYKNNRLEVMTKAQSIQQEAPKKEEPKVQEDKKN